MGWYLIRRALPLPMAESNTPRQMVLLSPQVQGAVVFPAEAAEAVAAAPGKSAVDNVKRRKR